MSSETDTSYSSQTDTDTEAVSEVSIPIQITHVSESSGRHHRGLCYKCDSKHLKRKVVRSFPPITWVPKYKLKSMLINDILAGITVGFMLIPQAMAYAIVAGLPPIHGLYASIFSTIVYMLFGTSRELAVGPVAMVSLLVSTSVSELEGVVEVGDDVYVGYALVLCLMIGIFQILMGLLNVGVVVNYLSHSVISGFTSAAAILIAWSQLKYAFGVSPESEEYFHMKVYALAVELGETHILTLIMCIITIIILVVIKIINKKKKWIIPGSLIVVVLSILISFIFDLENHGVNVIGNISQGFPTPRIPPLTWDAFSGLLLPMVIISVVGYMESVAVAQKIALSKEYEISPTQELLALGITNLVTSFFQGYPVTGGFSRTAVADNAGAKSPLYNLFASLIIISALLFLTKIIYFLCMNTLAAIIIVAVYGLFDYETAIELWKLNKRDLILLVIAFLCTLLIGIEIGLFVAVGISMVFVILGLSRPHISVLGKMPGSRNTYRNVKRYGVEVEKGIMILRIDAPIFFANTVYLKTKILKKLRLKKPQCLVLDMSGVNDIDSVGIHFLCDLRKHISKMDIKVYLASPIGPVRTKMKRGKIDLAYGHKNIHWTVTESIERFKHIRRKTNDEKYQPYVFDMKERFFSTTTSSSEEEV